MMRAKFRGILQKYLARRGYTKLSLTELQLLRATPFLIQEWVNNRKFRRQIKGTELSKVLSKIINEWKPDPETTSRDQ